MIRALEMLDAGTIIPGSILIVLVLLGGAATAMVGMRGVGESIIRKLYDDETI